MTANDLTPTLLRLAICEVMADRHRPVDSIAGVLGKTKADFGQWLNDPDHSGPLTRSIEREVSYFLARIEREHRAATRSIRQSPSNGWEQTVPASSPETLERAARPPKSIESRPCPRCQNVKPPGEMSGNGYCKPCMAIYDRERKARTQRKAS